MKEYFNGAFALNGLSVGYKDLSEVAYSLVKEGEPFEREIGDFLLDWVSDSPTVELQTSGSTGEPKRIHMPKSAMVRSALATGQYLDLPEGTRALLCLPARTVAGKMMLVRALVMGWKLYLQPPGSKPLEGLETRVDFVAMVPMQLEASLEDLGGIRMVLVGGAPLSRGLLARIPKEGTAIYESFGMTETASHVALRKLNPVPEGEDPEASLPPFRVLPGIEIEQDPRGCLVIRAPYLKGEVLVTNDLVSLESEETFRWLGRADHVVNSGGVKLIPERIEARIAPFMEHPFFLTGMPDETLGEKLVLVVEAPRDDSLLELLRTSADLGRFEVPREVLFSKGFVRTRSGKVNRSQTLENL